MKTIVLIEEAWTGHRPIFIKLFNKTLLEMGYQVFTFCPHPEELKDWIDNNSEPKEESVAFEYSRDTHPLMTLKDRTLLQKKVDMWKAAKQAVDGVVKQIRKKPDLVFFGVLDGYLNSGLTAEMMDEIFPYPWSGLYVSPKHLRLQASSWHLVPEEEQACAGLHAAQCKAVAVLDEGITNQLAYQLHGKLVALFPDSVTEMETDFTTNLLNAQIKAKAKGRKIIGLLGSISKRKSIFTLTQVAQKMIQENYFFVLAGPLYPKTFSKEEYTELQEFINLNLDNCFLCLDTIEEKEMQGLFSICDILFAVYEDFPHSSNTLIRASTFRKPLIVSKNYCMGERVAAYNIGIGVEEKNVSAIIAAIRQLTDTPLVNPDFEGYLQHHTPAKLFDAFEQVLSACFKKEENLVKV